MPRDQERRRMKLQRKTAKRKEHTLALIRTEAAFASPSQRRLAREAAHWALDEVWITRDWQQEGALAQAVVARRSPSGQIAAAVFLVDLGLLGAKNAFVHVFDTQRAYQELLDRLNESTPLVKTDLNLVAKVVDEAVAYAKRFGFSPHRDYYAAAPFLEGAEPEKSPARVPLGKDGKPFFVAGPHDNARKIVAQLDRRLGTGNYDYIVGASPAEAQRLGIAGLFEDDDEEE